MTRLCLLSLLLMLSSLASVGAHYNACLGQFPHFVYVSQFGDTCYAFVTTHQREYKQASRTCEYYNSTLATVTSADVNREMRHQLSFHVPLVHPDDKLWIGLSDLGHEDSYAWVDGTPMEYENFAFGQGPNYPARYGETCVAIDADAWWYGLQCRTTIGIFEFNAQRKFICQFPPPVRTTTDSPATTQAQTTRAPTTQAPTTQAPTTQAPTTQAQTTQAQTTQAQTTQAPTTQAPTTQAPTTQAPTTQAPTTQAPTTQAPTTQAQTTQAPTTQAPTTQAPTTQAQTT